jgi:hypothetical protein
MSALGSLKKHWYWGGLLALGGAIVAAALIAPSDMSRLLTALTLLLLGAGVALHPALALILDRERDARGPWASCVSRSTVASSSLFTSLNSILPRAAIRIGGVDPLASSGARQDRSGRFHFPWPRTPG